MMRPALVATTCALALASATGLAACGGDSGPYDQVPTSTPALVPPDDANDLASGGDTTATGTTTSTTPADTGADTGGTSDTDTGGTTDTGAGTGGTGTGDTGTGNTGGGTGDTGTGDTGGATPDTGGVSPDQNAGAGSFQKFCSDNPGAC